jgi:hypothetical protein
VLVPVNVGVVELVDVDVGVWLGVTVFVGV